LLESASAVRFSFQEAIFRWISELVHDSVTPPPETSESTAPMNTAAGTTNDSKVLGTCSGDDQAASVALTSNTNNNSAAHDVELEEAAIERIFAEPFNSKPEVIVIKPVHDEKLDSSKGRM
jgi:hypothetical protein